MRRLLAAAALLAPLATASTAAADAPRPVTVDVTAPWSSFAPNTPTLITAGLHMADGINVMSYCTTGGTLTFRDNGVAIATLPVDQYCSAYIRPSFTPGDHLLTVDFSGNAQYEPGTGSLAVFAFTNQPFSGMTGSPGTTGITPPTAPVPAPEPPPAPAPVAPPAEPAVPPVPTESVRSGLTDVDALHRGSRAVTFAQAIAAPGTIRWTLSRGDGSPALGTATATVAAGHASASIPLTTGARRWLRAHPHASLLLRSVLTLADGRAIGVSRRVSPGA